MTLNRPLARLPFAAAAALVTLTSFTLTAPASAAAPSAAPMATVATAVSTVAMSADTKICVVERLTGSRIDKKVCRTKAQWEALGGVPSN